MKETDLSSVCYVTYVGVLLLLTTTEDMRAI